MKMQALICEAGNHPWQRPSQRGRKPRFCPEHSETTAPRAVSVSVVEASRSGDTAQPERFAVGDLITNGSSAGKVLAYVEKDPSWKAPGYRVQNIALERFGGNVGLSSFVPLYLARSWRRVPLDWAPAIGGSLEERYVWADGHQFLTREVRKVEVEGDIICYVDPDYDETDDLAPLSELDPTTAGQRRAAMLDDRLKARGQHISQH